MLPIVEVAEWQVVERSGVASSLADQELSTVVAGQGAGALTVQWLNGGRVRVESASWVGVVRFSDFALHVVPKAAGGNLAILEMVDYVAGLDSVRRLPNLQQLQDHGTLLTDLVCWILVEEARRLLHHGLMSDYVPHEESIGVLRGRLQLHTQTRRHFGRVDVLECHFDEYEPDILENRLLASALRRARVVCTNARVRQLLAQVEPLYSEICPTDVIDVLDARQTLVYNRRNDHYRAAHHWAFLLLGRHAIKDLYASTGPASFAFMIDMNSLFEKFIARVITDELARAGASVRVQAHSPRVIVDESRRNYSSLIPDILVRSTGSGSSALPVDTKYKLYDERKVDPGDLYQLFIYAYCFSDKSHVPRAVLIYPSDNSRSGFSLKLLAPESEVEPELRVIGVHLPTILERIRNGRRPAPELAEEILRYLRSYASEAQRDDCTRP